QELIVDGFYGQIYLSPTKELREEFQALIQEEKKLAASLEPLRNQPAQTKDNHRVQLMVNTGLGADVSLALAAGAEGIGLYRTETPFMIRDRFPTAEEQRVLYHQLLA